MSRHRLAPESLAEDVVAVAESLVGIHSSDPVSVFLGALARLRSPRIGDVEAALYEHRRLVRVLGMRRTMFVVPTELAPILHHACALALASQERRRVVRLVEDAGLVPRGEGAAWVREVETKTLECLARRGEAVAGELSREVPELRAQIPFGEGKKWAGKQGVSTRVLFLLAAEGRAVRGRPRGSWISSQYRWATTANWLGSDIAALPVGEARHELLRRYLLGYGPVTAADIRWWTGWTAAEARRVIETLDPAPVAVELDGGSTGYVAGDDVDPVPPPSPSAALLPALDSSVMGWAERDWFLGPHRQALFDRSGNAGPTVWWDGRVVGGWAQRPDGEVGVRLLEKVGPTAERAIADQPKRLRTLIGDVRFTPRFRTPLERELSERG